MASHEYQTQIIEKSKKLFLILKSSTHTGLDCAKKLGDTNLINIKKYTNNFSEAISKGPVAVYNITYGKVFVFTCL